MLNMRYVKEQTVYEVDFHKISDHIVEMKGDFPVKTKGFTLSRDESDDGWDYKRFKTVYRKIEGGVQFSDDGSVYVAPPEPEPVPEPEPYVPTLDEVKAAKLQEIGMACSQTIYAGVDVTLPGGHRTLQPDGKGPTQLVRETGTDGSRGRAV